MGKKGKRTKWQVLSMEDTAPVPPPTAGGPKMRPFSTLHGDNFYKTAGSDFRSSVRQDSNPAGDRLAETEIDTTHAAEGNRHFSNHASKGPYNGNHRFGKTFGSERECTSSQYYSRYRRDINSVTASYNHKHSGTSSTTSSTTSSNHYEGGWRTSRTSHGVPSVGFNKENNGHAMNQNVQEDGEYTRITTPRQDVLFKKGYLSRPKRMSALEEIYLPPPQIVHQQSGVEEDAHVTPGNTENGATPSMENEPCFSDDNSPLYFCPGFVDHNGYFHANPTFMPNTFDQFGQPIVVMPYPNPTETDKESGETDNLTTDKDTPKEDISEEEQPAVHISGGLGENSIDSPVSSVPVPLDTETVADEFSAPSEEGLPSQNLESPQKDTINNNVIQLDPASSSFYPQSSVYPYYPLVIPPQQLPPNTSIIPLAELYYNENYAGLAAEIFGLAAEVTSPDVNPCDTENLMVPTVDCQENENNVPAVPLPEVTEGDREICLDSSQDSVSPTPIDKKSPEPPINNDNDHTLELAAQSNLNVDVAEFHPRNTNYPTLEQAAHQKPPRSNGVHALPMDSQYSKIDGNSQNRKKPQDIRRENRFLRKRVRSPVIAVSQIENTKSGADEKSKTIEKILLNPTDKSMSTSKVPKPTPKITNNKRAIFESIKHIEEQNIDLFKTRIGTNNVSSSESNQWLVKTKGKRTTRAIEIPEEDLFDFEEPQNVVMDSPDNATIERVSTETITSEIEVDTKASPKIMKSSQKTKKTGTVVKKSKSKSGNAKKVRGSTSTPSKGFEVIEPDFGVLKRLPMDFDQELQEELDNILNMKELEEELIRSQNCKPEEANKFSKSNSVSKSPRSDKDNVIDLDDLEALERSLMDFDLSGELKERMIEIIQSELEGPSFLGEVSDTEMNGVLEEDEKVDICVTEECENEIAEVKDRECPLQSEWIANEIEDEKGIESKALSNVDLESVEFHCENDEIINIGVSLNDNGTESSSSSSSLSSPIPTDDGRDGSNSESDDAMTPPATFHDDTGNRMISPSLLEERLNPLEKTVDTTASGAYSGITASVSKWLAEKEKENLSVPVLPIPNDPVVAKMILRAVYGEEFLRKAEVNELDEFETDDDMDSISVDDSDFETDSNKDRLSIKGLTNERSDNQVPIDTDSDYMSDGQNIKPKIVEKLPVKAPSGAEQLLRGGSTRGCKVM